MPPPAGAAMTTETGTETVRLTALSHGAGCACKLPLAALEELMSGLGPGLGATGGDLLVGAAEGDDAAVLRLDERRALVLTTDFFTPIVDDARDWGRVAAANALSDVYAMGGRPLLALNLVAWPAATLPLELLAEVLEGGAEVAGAAGCPVVGGHSIDDPEPKYGLAVVGLADPERLLRLDRARPGDQLVLTKPLGTGVVATAVKRGSPDPQVVAAAVASMTALNQDAAEAALAGGVVAATDEPGLPPVVATLLHDAQTSGGLLLAVAPERLAGLLADLRHRGLRPALVGRVLEGSAGRVRVRRLPPG